ncbi:GIY-YIG nuclease family protein [Ulvibacterium marinum]|uniref:GIY-YIG nuclease family protein n=1 Tax=Ulvibacterium marinum TaxID=2419782 RepID=UPI0024954A58|nr:GIY-YIG nuclease family protein [Ulvibacterium marinum]
MFYVYVLKSELDGRLYKGMTTDIAKRVEQHNSGKNRSTKGFAPWKLVYEEMYLDRMEARSREKYFKSGSGREFLKNELGL